MRVKHLVFFFTFFLFFTSFTTAAGPQTAGVSPDNPILWKIETFFEDANVVITSDPVVKMQKSLDHAEERIAEMEKMLRWNKTDSAEKALNKYDAILEKTQTIVTGLDEDDKQQALETELEMNASLTAYISHLVQLQAVITSTSHDASQTLLIGKLSERMGTTTATLEQALAYQKQQTLAAIKANGVTDEELLHMEQQIQESLGQQQSAEDQVETLQQMNFSSFIDTATNDSLITSLAENASTLAQQVADAATEFFDENDTSSSQDTKATATINDASSRNKLQFTGSITVDQEQKMNILYQQLQTEETTAEIEIVVSQLDNGLWRIEKEIDGTLSAQQKAQLDDLLLSFATPSNPVTIKIKYAPVSVSSSESTTVYSGSSDSGVSTSFEIG